ncbi:hypothetical protein U9M48_030260 [Paspalum notatum var. saurae]|uniref:BTB domain-containing protein n=1 Tax=Paspalum notatum var. saurae TaxID=547442 RepID=A0AAQ3X3J6_PASNO
MAQGLLVAADRYNMETLKLICTDMLYTYIDASTPLTTLELAYEHGGRRFHQACLFKFLNAQGAFHRQEAETPLIISILLHHFSFRMQLANASENNVSPGAARRLIPVVPLSGKRSRLIVFNLEVNLVQGRAALSKD